MMRGAVQKCGIVAHMEAQAAQAHLHGLIDALSSAAKACDGARVRRAAGALRAAFEVQAARLHGGPTQPGEDIGRLLRGIAAHARQTVRADAVALGALRREEASEAARRAAYRRAQSTGQPS